MSDELQGLFEILGGAFLGTIIGLAVGIGVAYLLDQPYNKAMGGQDSYAIAKGAVFMGFAFIGACLGFAIGVVTALVLQARSKNKKLPPQ